MNSMNIKNSFICGAAAIWLSGLSLASANQGARESLLTDGSLSIHLSFDQVLDVTEPFQNFAPTLKGEGQFVSGRVNGALSLEGDGSGQVRVPLVADHIDLKEGTIMFWFKPAWFGKDESGSYTFLWITMKDPDKYLGFHRSFSKDNPRLLYVNIANRNGVAADTSYEFNPDQWIHIAFTWNADDGSCVLFFNGKVAAKGTWEDFSGEAGFVASSLLLGKYYAKDDPINASYDDLFIFSRSLSNDELNKYINSCDEI